MSRSSATCGTHRNPDLRAAYTNWRVLVVTMAYATSTTIEASPDIHRLRAEFVAVDHGPFSPPVIASVTFRVTP